ncbi:hypothetical protein [Peterkaempfera bronchialis]|uniref:Uncharacterized protein n=1 Tax=Peterkaempfera bronchialis TaxID=2126346 RepID=A0A345T4J2_9ACTN|nr:hypothetical protein [Peterkaempfera bronchialis]AXI80897.1 hypothetical protein C7M71_029475 [Peterkaempfera bronchialis]
MHRFPLSAILCTACAVSMAWTAPGYSGPAWATTVVGAGNGAFDNACTTVSAPAAQTQTDAGGGLIGTAVSLPGGAPTNQCGNLGIGDTPDGRTDGPVGQTLHGLIQAVKGEK